MRLSRRARTPTEAMPTAHSGSSLVASAARIKLDGMSWRTYKFGDDTWQTEAWRLYDIVGELRFVSNWIGAACSRVRVYVAKVDDNGRVQQEVTTKKIAGLADTLFGGPAAKAEALRMLGINLTVAGDCFIVGRGTEDPKSDEWYIVSTSELKRWGNRMWQLSPDGSKEELDPSKDLVIRVWTPHPRRGLWADSPTRAAMPMLWEIERLTRYVFAQIDSRLVSAGVFPLPKSASFPDEVDDDGNLLTGSEALTQRMMRTASASLKGEGTAAGVVPIYVEVPDETLGKYQLIEFSSELSKQALELRSEAIRRFALAMDIEPSILSGMGEANHWGAWQIMEGQINVHIVPLMTRICDALTTAYLQPALKTIGEDEDRFVFWYDTAPLTVRPERLKDTLELYDKRIVSRETVLLAGDYKLSDVPDDDEDLRLFTRELMLRDPNLFQIPAVRKVAGYTEDVLPADTVVTLPSGPGQPGGAGPPPPPPPPPPPTGIQPTTGGPMPLESVAQNNPAGPPPSPNGVTAAARDPRTSAMNTFVVSNATVLRALERAGKRLLDRHSRDRWPNVPAYELHTRIRVGGADHAERLLDGAWDHLPALTAALDHEVDTEALKGSLQHYCMSLLVQEQPHDMKLLGQYLTSQGLL